MVRPRSGSAAATASAYGSTSSRFSTTSTASRALAADGARRAAIADFEARRAEQTASVAGHQEADRIQRVIDRAIQVFGGAGVSQDTPLAQHYAHARTLRLADGPDEVHLMSLAKQELFRHMEGSGAS